MIDTLTDQALTAAEAAKLLGISRVAFYKAVTTGRMPQPYYPVSRASRWLQSEIWASLERTRALPRDAKLARQTITAT
jgi:predicted DNA-binding transcriptional regulator AlpA